MRPVGISPDPVRDPASTQDDPWWKGHPWPPLDATFATRDGVDFPLSAWSTNHLSTVALGEFVRASANGKRWNQFAMTAYPTGVDLKKELDELHHLMEYRAGVMGEAFGQAPSYMDYFRGLLTFSQSSHPATFRLCWVTMRIAEFQVMHYKYKAQRPRPSYLSPALMPPLDPPGHAAYPSGHATESKLLALVLKQVMPAVAADPLEALAVRVARNREVLGVHYPSDSREGRLLAEFTEPILARCATVKRLKKAAYREWHPAP
ncbi:phosphatase PAP2 family protein [Alsobacter sp. R-9]